MSVDTDADLRQKAEELRKSGKFRESQEIYAPLWERSPRVLYGAGLLNCLRKLNQFDDALKLANELEPNCNEITWCRNEVVWTHISGSLIKVGENEPLQKNSGYCRKDNAPGP